VLETQLLKFATKLPRIFIYNYAIIVISKKVECDMVKLIIVLFISISLVGCDYVDNSGNDFEFEARICNENNEDYFINNHCDSKELDDLYLIALAYINFPDRLRTDLGSQSMTIYLDNENELSISRVYDVFLENGEIQELFSFVYHNPHKENVINGIYVIGTSIPQLNRFEVVEGKINWFKVNPTGTLIIVESPFK